MSPGAVIQMHSDTYSTIQKVASIPSQIHIKTLKRISDSYNMSFIPHEIPETSTACT